MTRILVAGIGNLFLGDDGFGVEVVQRMRGRPVREGVRVEDFGIRGIDLTYALLEGVDMAILVDATQRGGAPGTLYVLEPLPEPLLDPVAGLQFEDGAGPQAMSQKMFFSPHEMQPDRVLCAVKLLGGSCARVVLVGCEPESLGTEAGQEGRIGLSGVVAAAVEEAIGLVESLLDQAASRHTTVVS